MKAAVYARKSTEQKSTDARELSTVRQIETCRAVCAKRGWTVSGVYDEGDGVSGTKGQDKRPQLARLLADAMAGKFQVIVALNRDRLSRQGPASWLTMLETLTDLGVTVFLADEEREVDVSDEGAILEAVHGYRGRKEAKLAGVRTKSGKLSRFQSIEAWASGKPPFGYRIERRGVTEGAPRSGHSVLVIHPEQADVVKSMFLQAAKGVSVRALTFRLNEQGIPGPGGRPFHQKNLLRMLRSRLYCGETRLGAATRQTDSLRIVSDDLFAKAQATLKDHAAKYAGVRGPDGRLKGQAEGRVSGKYPFGGLLVCGECGERMWIISTRQTPYLACKRFASQGKAGCANSGRASYRKLTDSILTELASIRPETLQRLLDTELAKIESTRDTLTAQADAGRRAVADLGRKVERLIDARENGEPVGDRLKLRQRELDAARAALAALEARLGAVEASPDMQMACHEMSELVARLRSPKAHEIQACRATLKLLFPEGITARPPLADAADPTWRWRALVSWEDGTRWRQSVNNIESWLTPDDLTDEAGAFDSSTGHSRNRSSRNTAADPAPVVLSLPLRIALEGTLVS